MTRLIPVSLLFAIAFPAHAAMDITGADVAITDGSTAVATLGLAVLIFYIGLRMWKRIRGAA